MPCWQRQTLAIDWKNADKAILADTLKTMGFTEVQPGYWRGIHERYSVAAFVSPSGLEVQAGSPSVLRSFETQVRRAYSEQVLKTAAKRFGWNVQQDAKNPQQFTVRRRA